MTVIENDTIQ